MKFYSLAASVGLGLMLAYSVQCQNSSDTPRGAARLNEVALPGQL